MNVAFEICGPIEDLVYWQKCESLIARMPKNVTVSITGNISYLDVPKRLAAADLFFLPTRNENFGHAIFEALSCGTPVLISDTTPWRGLEAAEAGWDLPLSKPDSFLAAIHAMAALDDQGRDRLRKGARKHAEAFIAQTSAAAETVTLLKRLIEDAAGSDDL